MEIRPLINNLIVRARRRGGFVVSGQLVVAVCLLVIVSTLSVDAHSPKSIRLSKLLPSMRSETFRLLPGRVENRKIAGSSTHSYKIRLEAQQTFVATVLQRGIDLALTITAPDEKIVAYADS